jgi:hypothetical protein
MAVALNAGIVVSELATAWPNGIPDLGVFCSATKTSN